MFEDACLAASARRRTVLGKVALLSSQAAQLVRGRLYDAVEHSVIPGMVPGQVKSPISVSSIMPPPDEPVVNSHNPASSIDATPMQGRGVPDDNIEQSDDGDESDEWVFIEY